MTSETYTWMCYIFAGGSALMFIISIFLFFKLKIRSVIGDLTGATARKTIEDIRKKNKETGIKSYKVSAVNQERGKLTDKISENMESNFQKPSSNWSVGTEKLNNDQGSQETVILNESTNETVILDSGLNETVILDNSMNNTTKLYENTFNIKATFEENRINRFCIEEEITFIHTQERIAQ